MNYSFTRTYMLSQQTPLIHFQYDQDGATLRATEVKPKLDAFIRSHYPVLPQWKINGKEALRYRITFQTPVNESPQISKTHEMAIELHSIKDKYQKKDKEKEFRRTRSFDYIHPFYFANMVSDDFRLSDQEYTDKVEESYKETVMYRREKIKMQIVCMIPELLDLIDGCLECFFFMYNFGTRQSKGFGGFTLEEKIDKSEWRPSVNPIDSFKKMNVPFFYFVGQSGNIKTNMDHARTVYTVMKSGVDTPWYRNNGVPAQHVDSYIQRKYLVDLGKTLTGSEKDFIKSQVFSVPLTSRYTDYLFVRAMLGLADHYDFHFNAPNNGKVYLYSLGDSDIDIARFPSPITICFIRKYVVFWFDKPDAILNKTFYFMLETYANQLKAIDNNRNIPASEKYKEKKKLILKYGVAIDTPLQMNWNAFISGFIGYYNDPGTKKRLSTCSPEYGNSSALTLIRG